VIDKVWRVSTYTGSEGNCVEVGQTSTEVLVRDSKDRDGTVLTITDEAWASFTAKLK
jgi:hypothetical protein